MRTVRTVTTLYLTSATNALSDARPPRSDGRSGARSASYRLRLKAQTPGGRCRSVRPGPWTGPSRSGTKRLDPEVLGAHLDPLLRTASTLCDSRENAEDLVQETIARVLSRPRLLRGGDERAYLMQALRNTFINSRRTAARRPRVVMALEEYNLADRRTPEEAVFAKQVFPAIAQLPELFRLALVAVDIVGLSYGDAARVLGTPEATIATRLYRARQRVARELDPERSALPDPHAPASAAPAQPTVPQPPRPERPCLSSSR
jgi:RNA polymerase sigma-70 factor (ECF subfamily)